MKPRRCLGVLFPAAEDAQMEREALVLSYAVAIERTGLISWVSSLDSGRTNSGETSDRWS